MPKDLLEVSRELKSMAEAGLRYSDGPYDLERYKRLHEIASELLTAEDREFRWPVEIGYATPKVDVRAAVIREGKILLVREASSGQWTLPGGWADLNASPAENAAREVLEEAGIVVEVRKLIACWDKDRQGHPRQPEHVYKLVFLCEATGGELTLSHETDGADWFSPDALPDLCPYRAAAHYIDLAFTHAAQPELPTAFD
ncbi:NUDIX hydrolase [Luteolibacter soli]|uniref:NUDIX hydrolase N-terminal domain-containing protein n=1 Tax=Luteolibacter soli TaxID=3135280 RepID=A0ABU9AV40_9BACT